MEDKRLNCWEVLNCGQGPDNPESACPVPFAVDKDGINSGLNGGRYCWTFPGTQCLCGVQGTFARKYEECLACEFFKMVDLEQGPDFTFIDVRQVK